MSSSTIALTGRVASEVRTERTTGDTMMTKFRLAVPTRRYDRDTARRVTSGFSYYTVLTWRSLAQNVAQSVSKGDSLVVAGRLRVRDWTSDDGRRGTVAEISATAIGHDLAAIAGEMDAA